MNTVHEGLLLDEDEVVDLTGGYQRPQEQLRELLKRGYFRATRSKLSGRIVLPRAHVLAVDGGQIAAAESAAEGRGPKWNKAG